MSKRHRSYEVRMPERGKSVPVMHVGSVEATLMGKPYIDGYVCRGGVHGDTKYNRRKEKRALRRILDENR